MKSFNYSEMSGKQKSVMYTLIFLILIGGVSATWFVYHQTSETGFIISSSSELTFTDDFDLENIDLTTQSATKTNQIDLVNLNSDVNMTFNLNTTRLDVFSDSCTDFVDDCDVTATYNGDVLTDGDNVLTVPSGNTNLTLETSCATHTCPQTVTSVIEIYS